MKLTKNKLKRLIKEELRGALLEVTAETKPDDTLPWDMGAGSAQLDLFDPRYASKEHMSVEELGGRENVERWHQGLLDAGLDPAVSVHDALDVRTLVMQRAPRDVTKEQIAKVMSGVVEALMPLRGPKPWDAS
tara:strand:+ start:1126 stop:1524 length:399 start_codon:yes stop_codon:yes gene_type:complete